MFSTKNDDHALQSMREKYKDHTKHLLEQSRRHLKAFESDSTTIEAKRQLVETTIDYYLTATSHEKLFSRDVVLFIGRDKLTIMLREEFEEIKGNWVRLLSGAAVRMCVDSHRSDVDFSSYDMNASNRVCNDCMKYFTIASVRIE